MSKLIKDCVSDLCRTLGLTVEERDRAVYNLRRIKKDFNIREVQLAYIFREYADDIQDAVRDNEYADLYEQIKILVNFPPGVSQESLNPDDPKNASRLTAHTSETGPAYKPTRSELETSSASTDRMLSDMSRLPDVVRFRRYLPGRELLSSVDGIDFVRSPLTTLLNAEQLRQLDLSPMDRTWRLCPLNVSRAYEYLLVVPGKVDSPIPISHDPADLLQLRDWGSRLGFEVVDGSDSYISSWVGCRYQIDCESEASRKRSRARRLFGFGTFPGQGLNTYRGLTAAVIPNPFGFRGTILGEGLQIASDLAQYWSIPADNALTWLVTGEFPDYGPMQTVMSAMPLFYEDSKYSHSAYTRIHVNAAPWMSADSVARQFREAQELVYNGMLPDNKVSVKEKRLRQSGEHTMRIYNFVMSLNRVSGRKLEPWQALCRRYNADCGTAFTVSNFKMMFARAGRRIDATFLPRHERLTSMMEYRISHRREPATDGG